MATVYTHITPFQKRAISFFKQRLYEIGKRGKINSVIDELLRKQEFFKEFLASYGDSLQPWEREYIRNRTNEVVESLGVAYADRATLEGILKSLNPCPVCDGVGRLRHIVDQDHSEYSKCEACGGDGVARAKVA